MLLRTVVRDCLYLNWALPSEALGAAPSPLRYETHDTESGPRIFVSALLFRQSSLRWAAGPSLVPAYPQLNVRTYVTDAEGVPAVLFQAMFLPGWARWLARASVRVPGQSARFGYPGTAGPGGDGERRWAVRRRGRSLIVTARPGPPSERPVPDLGGWKRTTEHFRLRSRGYLRTTRGLRRVDAGHEPVETCPVTAAVDSFDLLTDHLQLSGALPELHSSWLCPRMPLSFEIVEPPETVVRRQVPATG